MSAKPITQGRNRAAILSSAYITNGGVRQVTLIPPLNNDRLEAMTVDVFRRAGGKGGVASCD